MKVQLSTKEKMKKNLKPFYWIIPIQCLLASIWLLLLPGEEQNAQFLGYSLRRLLLLIPLNFPILIIFVLRSTVLKDESRIKTQFEQKKGLLGGLVIINGIGGFALWSAIFLYHFLRVFGDVGFYLRLLPLFVTYLIIAVEFQIFLFQILANKKGTETKKPKINLSLFLVIFSFVLLGLLLISLIGWGYAFNRVVIVSLNVPLLEGQVVYIAGALLLVMSTYLSWKSLHRDDNVQRKIKWDAIVFLAIWIFAVALWMSQPLPDHNYFAPQERERSPNFEKYPFSDAEQYDYNSLFLLHGTVDNFVISKPFYVSFLTILHAAAGLEYNRIVFLQTLVIALFPGVLYLIGKELHSRLGGTAMAFFVIFRELNSIQAGTMANVTNTKLLLSEDMAALLMGVLAVILIRWFKSPREKISYHPFLAGGLTGMLILTRLQTMAFIPFFLLAAIIRYPKSLRRILLSFLVVLLGCGLVLTPILIRNHSITGVFWVDNPASSGGLYRFYTTDSSAEIDIPDADTPEELIDRNISVIMEIFTTNFGSIVNLMMDNFMRNEASAFLTLPIRLGNDVSLIDTLMVREPFWAEIYSQPNFINLLVFLISAALFSLGFSSTLKKNPKAIVIFLGLHITYSLSSAIFRLSGWRFIQPVDWMLFSFFALGMVEAIQLTTGHFTSLPYIDGYDSLFEEPAAGEVFHFSKIHFLFFGFIFLFVGSFIPLREALYPDTVPDPTREEICDTVAASIQDSPYPEVAEEFRPFCLDPETRAVKGYGIYPRFFEASEGYYDRPDDIYFGEQDFNRLSFRVIGKPNLKVLIRTNEPDIYFPNGETVYVVGNNNKPMHFVLVEGEKSELIISELLLEKIE